ncbi:MAG: DUF2254 domain-containing protein [Paracoccaceae bacterium]
MISKRLWQFIRLSRELWLRVTLIAFLAVLAAAMAGLLEPYIPHSLEARFGEEAVMPLLNILATSMLAVTTFSLSVMVTAHMQAASQVTPRSHRLLLEDSTTQTVLATFLGAFIFALVSIILFRAGVYGARASVVVFFFTVAVVTLVVLAILRWIEHLSRLGSMDETIRLVEARARKTLDMRRAAPSLGARPLTEGVHVPGDAAPISAHRGGYVQFIDMPGLTETAEAHEAEIFLVATPGSFVVQGEPLARATAADDALADAMRAAFYISDLRTFDQDAGFALLVLSEIASRALSPGMNDPGTAIDVIGRLERLLSLPVEKPEAAVRLAHKLIWAPPITEADMILEAFDAIARDGAGMVEVALRLQSALNTLRGGHDEAMARAAEDMARRALAHAEGALALEEDRARVRALSGL